MTDIEKRASTKYQPIKFVDGTCDKDVILFNIRMEERRVAYIQGATEQKTIDIYKACKWLESHFRDIENPDFYSRRNHPTDLESMYHWSVKELVDDFRKAMEE